MQPNIFRSQPSGQQNSPKPGSWEGKSKIQEHKNKKILNTKKYPKHRKNRECCPMSLLIVMTIYLLTA